MKNGDIIGDIRKLVGKYRFADSGLSETQIMKKLCGAVSKAAKTIYIYWPSLAGSPWADSDMVRTLFGMAENGVKVRIVVSTVQIFPPCSEISKFFRICNGQYSSRFFNGVLPYFAVIDGDSFICYNSDVNGGKYMFSPHGGEKLSTAFRKMIKFCESADNYKWEIKDEKTCKCSENRLDNSD